MTEQTPQTTLEHRRCWNAPGPEWFKTREHTYDTLPEWSRLALAAPADDWRGIETAPKDGTEVLICWAGDLDVVIGWWEKSRGYFGWHEASRPRDMQPTHWRPIPAAPADGAG